MEHAVDVRAGLQNRAVDGGPGGIHAIRTVAYNIPRQVDSDEIRRRDLIEEQLVGLEQVGWGLARDSQRDMGIDELAHAELLCEAERCGEFDAQLALDVDVRGRWLIDWATRRSSHSSPPSNSSARIRWCHCNPGFAQRRAGGASSSGQWGQCPSGFVELREDHWTIGGDCDRVLEVGRQGPIHRHRSPTVLEEPDLRRSQGNLRLDANHHALAQERAAPWRAIVRDLRGLVHRATDSVPDEVADHVHVVRLGVFLNRMRHVRQPVAGLRLGDPRVHRVLAYVEKLLLLFGDLPNRDGHAGIREIALVRNGHIERDDVALLDLLGTRNPVDYYIVDRHADVAWKAVRTAPVAIRAGLEVIFATLLGGVLVDLLRCHAGPGERDEVFHKTLQAPPGLAHRLDLSRRFQGNCVFTERLEAHHCLVPIRTFTLHYSRN